jgi:hypothetical protein
MTDSYSTASSYVLRTGSPWRETSRTLRPVYDHLQLRQRYTKAGIWLKIFDTLAAKSPQFMQLIKSSNHPAHQHVGRQGTRITPFAVLVEARVRNTAPSSIKMQQRFRV